MANSEKKTQYNIQYAKKNLKRVPLDLQIEKYHQVKTHAESRGESLNGFIKRAIESQIKADNGE